MKIIKQQGRRCSIKLSQSEWQEIGDKAGWAEEIKKTEEKEKKENGELPEPDGSPLLPSLINLAELEIEVEKYSDRTWAVYANGELLCVTAYRKGAYAVRELLERMLTEIVVLREQVKANAEMNGELQVVREEDG